MHDLHSFKVKNTNAHRLRTDKPIIIHEKQKGQCEIQCTMQLQH